MILERGAVWGLGCWPIQGMHGTEEVGVKICFWGAVVFNRSVCPKVLKRPVIAENGFLVWRIGLDSRVARGWSGVGPGWVAVCGVGKPKVPLGSSGHTADQCEGQKNECFAHFK